TARKGEHRGVATPHDHDALARRYVALEQLVAHAHHIAELVELLLAMTEPLKGGLDREQTIVQALGAATGDRILEGGNAFGQALEAAVLHASFLDSVSAVTCSSSL